MSDFFQIGVFCFENSFEIQCEKLNLREIDITYSLSNSTLEQINYPFEQIIGM